MRLMWPNMRPSTSPAEEESRWIIEANVGPNIAIFSNGRSSMTNTCAGEPKRTEEENADSRMTLY